MLLMRQAKGPCLGGKRAAPAPPGGGGHGVQANSQGAPLPGGGLGARSIGRGVSDAPGSLQACTGWSSPWRPCRRREEAESLGAAQGGEGGAGGSGLPRAWVQQASLAGSRDQAAGDGGPVSQAAPGKKSGAPGVLGMGEGMEAWGHGCYQSVVVGLCLSSPSAKWAVQPSPQRYQRMCGTESAWGRDMEWAGGTRWQIRWAG